jgi:hypothetical protein
MSRAFASLAAALILAAPLAGCSGGGENTTATGTATASGSGGGGAGGTGGAGGAGGTGGGGAPPEGPVCVS